MILHLNETPELTHLLFVLSGESVERREISNTLNTCQGLCSVKGA